MPRLKTETFGAGDQSWLGSLHGINNARTETLDPTAFTAGTDYPNGFIPSGFPVAIVSGFVVPYAVLEATTTGAGVLAGHLLTDQPVVGTGKFAVPVIDHGRVKATKIAVLRTGFVKPVAAAKNATTIIYI